jgi:hypothetical protein
MNHRTAALRFLELKPAAPDQRAHVLMGRWMERGIGRRGR